MIFAVSLRGARFTTERGRELRPPDPRSNVAPGRAQQNLSARISRTRRELFSLRDSNSRASGFRELPQKRLARQHPSTLLRGSGGAGVAPPLGEPLANLFWNMCREGIRANYRKQICSKKKFQKLSKTRTHGTTGPHATCIRPSALHARGAAFVRLARVAQIEMGLSGHRLVARAEGKCGNV